jgi:hypothetical protein
MPRAVRGEHHYQYMKQEKKSIFFFGAFCAEVRDTPSTIDKGELTQYVE